MGRISINPFTEDDSPLPLTERQAFYRLLSAIFSEMKDTPDKWAACLGLGTSNCSGMSIAEMAKLAHCKEATLIQGAVKFCAGVGIQASPHLRSAIKARIGSGELSVQGA